MAATPVEGGRPRRRRGRRVVGIHDARYKVYNLDGPRQKDISLLELNYDRDSGRGSYVMRMHPGSVTTPHEHRHVEEFLVLDGHLVDDDGSVFGPGDWVRYEPGTCHNSHTEDGCLLLVWEWQGARA